MVHCECCRGRTATGGSTTNWPNGNRGCLKSCALSERVGSSQCVRLRYTPPPRLKRPSTAGSFILSTQTKSFRAGWIGTVECRRGKRWRREVGMCWLPFYPGSEPTVLRRQPLGLAAQPFWPDESYRFSVASRNTGDMLTCE